MSTELALEEAILDSELRHINFFNGRLLTGGDLQTEQSVDHAHGRHLGSALGSGVAFGLEVSEADDSPPSSPIVVVTAGVAVNRSGQTLRLECDQRVALTKTPDQAAVDQCIFTDCDPASTGATLASSAAYYVMTIAPASLAQGKAPVSGLGNAIATCNSAYNSDGVKFRLFLLNLPVNTTNQARNLLSQACFGRVPGVATGAWPSLLPASTYGWETLMPKGFDATTDVPLAVLEWTTDGLGFIKLWPVRRQLTPLTAATDWGYFVSARRVAEGEAMFLDFQDDLATLGTTGAATDHFSFLPAGGVLPASAWQTFLGQWGPPSVTPVDPGLWPALLRETFSGEPIWLTTSSPFPAVKVYRARIRDEVDRDEVLFARSPLGRLQLTRDSSDDNLQALIIHCADGSLHSYKVGESMNSLVADDLPPGAAELWLIRAETTTTEKTRLNLNVEYDLALAQENEMSARTTFLGDASDKSFEAYMSAREKTAKQVALTGAKASRVPTTSFLATLTGTLDMTKVTKLLGKTSIAVQDGIVVVSGQIVKVSIQSQD